jgi:hypothetical protein
MSVTYIHGICIPDKQRNLAKLFQEIGKMFLNSGAVQESATIYQTDCDPD